MKNIFETILDLNYLKTLAQIAQLSGMEKLLSSKSPLTLFAPNDGAFVVGGSYNPENPAFKVNVLGDTEDILKDRESAARFLLLHLLPERITYEDLLGLNSVTSLSGQDLSITNTDGEILVANASIFLPNIECNNGLIHITNEVLMATY